MNIKLFTAHDVFKKHCWRVCKTDDIAYYCKSCGGFGEFERRIHTKVEPLNIFDCDPVGYWSDKYRRTVVGDGLGKKLIAYLEYQRSSYMPTSSIETIDKWISELKRLLNDRRTKKKKQSCSS